MSDKPKMIAPPPAAPGAESLDDLAREAAAAAPPPPEEPQAAPELVEPVSPSAALEFGCMALVKVMGGIICARADVAPLTDAECQGVGKALAGVAVYYLPTNGDPRLMAWVTLALAVGSVAAPRMRPPEPGLATAP